MNLGIDKKRFKLYLGLGATYLALWLFTDLFNNPDTILKRLVNHIWLISYLVVINFILFEYTLPSIRLTWKRVLLAPFPLFAHMLLYSYGLYGWRQIGIQLQIYFPLIIHPTIDKAVEYQMPYSMLSVLFFGITRHIYDYRKLKEAAQLLRIEKQEAELNYLKSQTNPHFLFNTLKQHLFISPG
ncbi:MAG: histidine kinase [Bacteroidota bacterium]|nr:histidine kinase [Bacteroidota bacterium]